MRGSISLTSSFAALAGIALLAGAVAAAYFGMRGVNETLREERMALGQAADIESLQVNLKEVEALQREYLITGEAALAARFATQREQIRVRLADLGSRFEHPEQRAAMPALASAIMARLTAIEQTMQERRTGGAEEAVRLAFTPARAAVEARADELLEQLLKRNRSIIAQREAAATEDLGFLERAMLAGILLAGALLVWSWVVGGRRELARRAVETALQARSRELRLLIDAVPATIAYVDPAERVLLHNRAFAKWLGLPSARIEGHKLREVLGEAEYAAASPYIARALAGEAVHYERKQRLDDGSVHDLAVAYVPHRNSSGAVLGYYALLTDITGVKDLSRMKSEFVSMVSHEVRTPATAIRGALGMLAGGAAGALPPEAGRLVGIAHTSSERLVRLVDDILDIEKIEAGEIAIVLRDEDVARLVPLALITIGPLAIQRGVRLEMAGDAPAAVVRTDAGRATQVLTNLLTNAIQFSPAGGVVRVAVEARNGMVRVSVRDHGPGVSDELRPQLFQKFNQDAAAARGSSGRFGLGLAISKMLIERLGGGIGYDPAAGGGAVFWFELPAAAGGSSRAQAP